MPKETTEIEKAVGVLMQKAGTEFTDITIVSTPSGEKHMKHILTGKILVISAKWKGEQ